MKLIADNTISLRVNSIDASAKGNTLCLKCQYALDPNERLSAIQWYRNSQPIYYYTNGATSTNDKPLDLHYSSDGFEVDVRDFTHFYVINYNKVRIFKRVFL